MLVESQSLGGNECLWSWAEEGWELQEINVVRWPHGKRCFISTGVWPDFCSWMVKGRGAGTGWQMGVTLRSERPAPAVFSLLIPIMFCLLIFMNRKPKNLKEMLLFSNCFTNNVLCRNHFTVVLNCFSSNKENPVTKRRIACRWHHAFPC